MGNAMRRFIRFFFLAVIFVCAALFSMGCNATVAENGQAVEDKTESQPTISSADSAPAPNQESPETELQSTDEVQVITFDDLNIGMQKDMPFRPVMLEYENGRAKKLIGKRINVGGYMNATDDFEGVKEFILLKNLDCKFGPGGQADHLVHVLLQGDATTNFTDSVIYVEGELELKPYPDVGPTWSIYDLKATKVSTRPPPRDRR